MKKLFIGFFALALANFSYAQTAIKNEKVKFLEPKVEVVKFDPPAKSKSSVKNTSPIVTKRKFKKKNKEQVKFTPPVIVKDKP